MDTFIDMSFKYYKLIKWWCNTISTVMFTIHVYICAVLVYKFSSNLVLVTCSYSSIMLLLVIVLTSQNNF